MIVTQTQLEKLLVPAPRSSSVARYRIQLDGWETSVREQIILVKRSSMTVVNSGHNRNAVVCGRALRQDNADQTTV